MARGLFILTEQTMRIRTMLMAVFVAGGLAAPMHAQDTTHKPGGLNKVAHDVSKNVKKAGRDTKAEVKRDASKAHASLTKAGNDTKETAGEVTGIHKVGGDVGKAAKSVSHTSKKAGAQAKHSVKKSASKAHHELTKTGKAAKDSLKTKKP
jgi:hypothetical protein